jgi:uncharacterized protein
MIEVEVAYATPEKQALLTVKVPKGATIEAAIQQSNVLERFPEIDLTTIKVGVFSEPATLQTLLQPGDRVEIYRPLVIDPKEARRMRAKKRG